MTYHLPRSEALVIRHGGRIVIPAAIREALGVGPGDEVLARVEDGELRITTRAAAIRRIQDRLARYKKPGESVVDEFLAERRAMWGEE